MKTCFKCGVTRPLSEFYKHPQMADGHVNKCKECNKQDVRQNYIDNHDRITTYERRRSKFPHRRELNTLLTQKSRKRFPKKYQAHCAVNNAIRDGRLQRQSCERCGSLRTHGHHEDYSKPLEVMWLCPTHHKERHKELADMGIEL